MRREFGKLLRRTLGVLAVILIARAAFAQSIPLQEKAEFHLNGTNAVITGIESLPFVDSEYTRLFKFDSADNPKLKELRTRYKLEEVIAGGENEFQQQVLLMDWVHHCFKKFGQPTEATRGALEILNGIEAGETFFCTQFAQLFTSAAASLGWVDRVLALRRHSDEGHTGSTEHSTTEIWSNQYSKWVMLDPTSNMYLESGGIPLNAHEIRQEWFYRSGTNLTFVVGKDRKRYRKSDLPILLKSFPKFGDLTIDPHELDKYGFIGYIPNTDLMDSGFNYADMFITKDELCAGTKWHKRKLPANPATDPYFPINQAGLNLSVNGNDTLLVHLKTFTPNFKEFEIRIDRGDWQKAQAKFLWKPHSGTNHLEARAWNHFNRAGPIATLELKLRD